MEKDNLPLPLNLENAKFTHKGNKNIEINIKTEVPKKLYKYYSLSDYSLNGLKNNTLYFSHSHLLNDVMDGNFMLWNFDAFLKEFHKETNNVHQNETILNELRNLTEKFLKNRGILSLSDNYNNELLWIHYTNESGYCIEIETQVLKKSLEKNRKKDELYFFPISYGELKQINFNEHVEKSIISDNSKTKERNIDANLPILYTFAQKDVFWKYENEWRFLLKDLKFNSISFPISIINDAQKEYEDDKKSDGNVEIQKEAITKIILAPLFFNNSRFNNLEYDGLNVKIYNFKENNSGKSTKAFLEILKSQFSDRIFQVDKIVKNEIVYREILYKIEIIDIGNNYIKIQKEFIKNGS
jgi:hypothetical protein